MICYDMLYNDYRYLRYSYMGDLTRLRIDAGFTRSLVAVGRARKRFFFQTDFANRMTQ